MNIWTGHERNQIPGLLLHIEHNTRTVQEFVYCGVETTEKTPDFIKMNNHNFGSTILDRKMNEMNWRNYRPKCILANKSNDAQMSKSKNSRNAVQLKRTKPAGQWQFITAKQVKKNYDDKM